MPHYQVLFEKRALKRLKKLSFKIQEKILEALRILRDEGFSPKLNIKNLKATQTITELKSANTEYYSN